MKIFAYTILVMVGTAICKNLTAQEAPYIMPVRGLCAHRGGMDTHPENTMPAFKNAIAEGVQMIEFDIQFSKDSALVIMHDETADRTTDGSGKMSSLTLAQIKQLDAGIKKGKQFSKTQVPTLEETLAIMPRNIWLNCHLKGDSSLGKAVALMVEKSGRIHQCLLACSEDAAAGARRSVPQIIICNAENKYRRNNAQYVQATILQKASFIQLVAVGLTEERKPFIKQLKDNGVRINYYYAERAAEAAPLWQSGIDFILVNDLPLFLPEMKKQGIETWKNKF